MTVVTVDYAKTHLSRLLAEPAVRKDAPPRKRMFGFMKGRVAMDDSFFDPLPEEELALWEGGPDDK
jgi:hypothetical protein